jgi:hypothetical protein
MKKYVAKNVRRARPREAPSATPTTVPFETPVFLGVPVKALVEVLSGPVLGVDARLWSCKLVDDIIFGGCPVLGVDARLWSCKLVDDVIFGGCEPVKCGFPAVVSSG